MLPTRAASAFHAAVHDMKVERLATAARKAARELLATREARMLANEQRFMPNVTLEMPIAGSKATPRTPATPTATQPIQAWEKQFT